MTLHRDRPPPPPLPAARPHPARTTRHVVRWRRPVKLDRYLVSGALEVWLVDLEHDEVTVHTREGRTTVHRRGEHLTTPVLPGWRADVDDLLGPPTT